MKVNYQKWIHRLLSVFIIVTALVGAYQNVFREIAGGGYKFLYFTVQSNLWIALIYIYFVIAEWIEERKRDFEIPNGMRMLKYIFTVSITLTFIVFFTLLVPDLGAIIIELEGNTLTHFWAPVAAIIDFIVFERDLITDAKTIFYTILPPLIYVIVTIVLSLNGMTYAMGEPVPYFFLNYQELGWLQIGNGQFGVVYWVLILLALILFIGYVLTKLNQWVGLSRNS